MRGIVAKRIRAIAALNVPRGLPVPTLYNDAPSRIVSVPSGTFAADGTPVLHQFALQGTRRMQRCLRQWVKQCKKAYRVHPEAFGAGGAV